MESDCVRQTWTETCEAISPRASMTERARREACRRVGEDGDTVARVAAQYGCGWQAIMAAVIEYGTPLVDDPQRLAGVTQLGVDETAFLSANGRHSTIFATDVVDLIGPTARLLDVMLGRSGKAPCDWVSERDPAWRGRIKVAALDPFRGYATALSNPLPDATRVLDAFHVAASGSARSMTCAAACSKTRLGTAAAAITRCSRSAGYCRRRADRLTDRGWDRLPAALAAGDVDQQIALTWIAAQDLRAIYARASRYAAEQHLHRWLTHCAEHDIPELRRLARTIDAWRGELLAHFDTGGVSNGLTEATNSLIKKVNASDRASATSTTTGYGYAAASTGRLPDQHESEADYHAWPRRAINRG